MKSLYMFSTRLRVYLIELPLLIILTIAIHFNDKSEDLLKFYPLIIVVSLGMIFILIYFFRGVSLSYEEIRTYGLFAKRDSAMITKDKVLCVTICPKKIVRLYLWGNDGTPAFDWQKEEDVAKDGMLRQISCKVIGGKRLAKRILKFYTVDAEALEMLATKSGAAYENADVSVASERKNEIFEIRISFKTDFDAEEIEGSEAAEN